jgi:hypothetical protein
MNFDIDIDYGIYFKEIIELLRNSGNFNHKYI